MNGKYEQLLRVVMQSESVFVPVDYIGEIVECNYVKLLPDLKKNIVGLTLINNVVLPIISFSDATSLPFRGIVIRRDGRNFFLKVDTVSDISEIQIDKVEKTDNDFIVKTNGSKIIDVDSILRFIS